MPADQVPIKGRGTASNPPNRFEPLAYVPEPPEDPALDEDGAPADPARPATRFYRDLSKSILSYNDSPDISFETSVNPYRGCEHGCVYCYARPMHEYLGFSAGLDFETQIMVKENAPELLRKALADPKWKPQFIALSGATDPYQPMERRLGLTRKVLEVLRDFRNPVGIITKNHLVTRDADILGDLASFNAACVNISITSLDSALTSRLEPRTSHPARRLEAVRKLRAAGVPVGIIVAPVIPALNDREIPAILEAAAEAGAQHAHYVMLRLPHAVGPLFEEWLRAHFPQRAERVLGHVRAMRGGKLYESRFGARMRASGAMAEQIQALFEVHRARVGLADESPELSAAAFRRPGDRQLTLFDDPPPQTVPGKLC